MYQTFAVDRPRHFAQSRQTSSSNSGVRRSGYYSMDIIDFGKIVPSWFRPSRRCGFWTPNLSRRVCISRNCIFLSTIFRTCLSLQDGKIHQRVRNIRSVHSHIQDRGPVMITIGARRVGSLERIRRNLLIEIHS